LGQWLHVKRIEANLTQLDICRHLKIGERRVLGWERDALKPSSDEWERLRQLLNFDSGIPQPDFLKCATMAQIGG
jgi:transcriptional regulator with XRE-family HTH domain